jgi:hypothetical protein
MTIAPVPMYPERSPNTFQRQMAPGIPGNRGPLRFQEGVMTDTDVPMDFGIGAYEDTAPSPMRMNHNNPEMFYKYPEETMRERAHMGSATWIEAPALLSDFVGGSMDGDSMPEFTLMMNDGGHQARPNKTVVYD